ncbi:outer membrane protein assembly factor BamD [Treponema pectinovorum]|uniref:tetratricopeptide repeat protein n=1 Tax=Treponema pectinovorum TaxID=164 RepID=UPI0011CA1869|nr:tetratricopeptide repeat protein [Treponema pectinovorum]
MKLNSILLKSFFVVCTIYFYSCNSVPKEIPENLTAQELIQNGQSNFEIGNYKAALAYYEEATLRFRDWPSVYIEARYEIGHLYMKQKKYENAEPIFNEILEIYKSSAPGSIPAAYKKLSEISLAKIPNKN